MARLSLIKSRKDIGQFGIALYNPKNNFNVGGSIRAAGAFEASFLAVSGERWKNKGADWRHLDTEGAHIRLPVYLGVPDLFPYFPYGVEPVAVELSDDASSLVDFEHPQSAVYLFGPEDGALPPEILGACKKKVFIPTAYSLNLYTAVTAVAYDRTAKRSRLQNAVACPECHHTHYRVQEECYICNACNHVWGKNVG